MLKNTVERGRSQMTIRRMHIACSMTKATNTHSQYVTLTVFHSNSCCTNAPQCYVINTLPVLFIIVSHVQLFVSITVFKFIVHYSWFGSFKIILRQRKLMKCSMCNVRCTMYNVQYSVQDTMYNMQCTIYDVQYAMYNIQCTIYNVQYAMYNLS